MYVYRIPMKFKYASSALDHAQYARSLEQAQVAFNAHAEKMKKARKITTLEFATDGFVIHLSSKDALTNPSKALAPFSRELAKMKSFAPLLDEQNHLLCNNGPAELVCSTEEVNEMSTAEILKTVVDIFMNAHVTDSVFVTQGRRDAQKAITTICQTFRSLM